MLSPFIYLHMFLFVLFLNMCFKKINQLICLIELVFELFFWVYSCTTVLDFSCHAGSGVNNNYFSKTINSLSGPLVELFVIAEAKKMLK